jgi:hypothetical protein
MTIVTPLLLAPPFVLVPAVLIVAELSGIVMRRNTLDAQVTRRADLTGTVTRR